MDNFGLYMYIAFSYSGADFDNNCSLCGKSMKLGMHVDLSSVKRSIYGGKLKVPPGGHKAPPSGIHRFRRYLTYVFMYSWCVCLTICLKLFYIYSPALVKYINNN